MANIFIDCGTNFCQGLKQHVEKYGIDENWIIHTFEANPYTYKFARKIIDESFGNLNITSHNKAVWIDDSSRYMIVENLPTWGVKELLENFNFNSDILKDEEEYIGVGGASNILQENYNFGVAPPKVESQQQVKTECVDLSKFIIDNFNDGDNIYIKIDIEGAEYPVIDKLISTGATKNVKEMVVEWHHNLLENSLNANDLINKLRSLGIEVSAWY